MRNLILDSWPQKTALILEDMAFHRSLLSFHVLEAGFVTIEAEGVQEAIEILELRRPRVYVLDLNLEDGTCWDFLTLADALTGWEPPVIVVSVSDPDSGKGIPEPFKQRVVMWISKHDAGSELRRNLRLALDAVSATDLPEPKIVQFPETVMAEMERLVRKGNSELVRVLALRLLKDIKNSAQGNPCALCALPEDG